MTPEILSFDLLLIHFLVLSCILQIRMANEIKRPIEDTSPENKLRFRAAQVMMEGVTHAEAKKSSQAVSFLRKWVLAMLNAEAVHIKMVELGYL